MPEPKLPTNVDTTLLTIDAGTSILKFAMFTADGSLRQICTGFVEGIGTTQSRIHATDTNGKALFDEGRRIASYSDALKLILDLIETHVLGSRLRAIGHRVAHGGSRFVKSVILSERVESELKKLVHLSPLRQPNNIGAVVAARAIFTNIVHVACFDSAFHQRRPEIATFTGLRGETNDAGLRRFGTHGLAFEHAIDTLHRRGTPVSREKIIMVHLDDNASICALKYGTSVEVATDFSPLAGLRFGIFCGALDRATIVSLLSRKEIDAGQTQQLISEADKVPERINLAFETNKLLSRFKDPLVLKAVEMFCYQVRKQLVGLTAALGGLDRLVFTGRVGVNAPLVRAKICAGLEYLDIAIDTVRNTNGAQTISSPVRAVTIETVATDEAVTVARHVRHILREKSNLV